MASKKHYIITSVILGSIAAVSGALIGLTNLVTKAKIEQNEKDKIRTGFSEIYGKSSLKYEEKALIGEYQYVQYAYEVKDENDEDIGYAFRTTGSNMYGKISLIVGFVEGEPDPYVLRGISIITNEQTYATTLVENYVDPLNKGDIDIDDVKCDATYGAKLVRSMINEASEASKEFWKV